MCEHQYKLMYSTFGADQGAMCLKCYKAAPPDIEKILRREKLRRELDYLK
jgi:hypothetical protein